MVQNIDSSTFSFSLLSTSNYFYALALVMWTCVYYGVSPYNKPIFSIEKTGEKHFEDINRELYWKYYRNYIVGKWKVEKISNCPYKHTPTIKKRECENHMTCCKIIKYLKELPVFRSSTMFSLWGSERHVVIKFYLSIYTNESLFVPLFLAHDF